MYAGVAIHPNEAHSATPEALGRDRGAGPAAGVRAVGETGLDYYRDWASRRRPARELPRAHRDRQRTGKALVIHDREAHEDVLAVLAAEGAPGGDIPQLLRGRRTGKRCAAAGYYMSFSGPVTYKNAGYLREAARVAPKELLLVETDAPYLRPCRTGGSPTRRT